MNAQRARRLLIAAFAISLLIHLIIASGLRWPFEPAKEEVQTTVRIEHTHALRVTRLPTPPPHTPPPVTPHPSAPPTASPNPHPARSASATGIGPQQPPSGGAPPTTAPPAATPRPAPTPNCALSDTTALLTQTPSQPEIAPDARGAATNGTTRVRVSLDANGAVQQTVVLQSSGNTSLDLVAVGMARDAHYTPATHLCKPVASEYIFSAKFSAW